MKKIIFTLIMISISIIISFSQINIKKVFEAKLLPDNKQGAIRKMVISPDGKYISIILVTALNRIRQLYKIKEDELIQVNLDPVNGGTWKDDVGSIAFTKDSQHLIFINNFYNSFYIWEVTTGKYIKYICNGFLLEHEKLSVYPELFLFNLKTGKLEAEKEYLYRDNKFYKLDGELNDKVLFNTESYKWEGANLFVSKCYFYNNGKNALINKDPGKYVYSVDCSTGQIISTSPKLKTIYNIIIKEDEQKAILRGLADKSYIYDIKNNVIEAEILAKKGCYGMSVSKNYFAFTGRKNIVIGKLSNPNILYEFEHKFNNGDSVTMFTKDEKYLIVGISGKIQLYKINHINQ